MRRAILFGMLAALSGCCLFPSQPPAPTPSPTQAPGPAPSPVLNRQVFVSGPALVNGVLSVDVRRAGTSERLADATVTLIGPTPAWGITDLALAMRFDPLEAGTYALRVSAPGLATRLVTGLTVDPKTPIEQTVELSPQAGAISGTVTGPNGPIEGARITADESWTFSGADGRFTLEGLGAGTHALSIRKGLHTALTQQVSLNGADVALGNLALARQSSKPVVVFENDAQPFGSTTVGSALSALKSALGSDFTVSTNPADTADVRVVVSPRATFADGPTTERLRAFVASGGTLVLMGEWGGFGDYSPEGLNRIARPFGLAFSPDLVRTTANPSQPGWIKVTALDLPALHAMPTGVTFYEACSIFAPPTTRAVARAGDGGYRIAAGGSGPALAVAQPYGQGLVLAVGDTSAWSAGYITGEPPGGGAPGQTNNLGFVLNLFKW
ncbi:carboxypeptidase regulatory-like domain-containing protein [bacterium]|nr:carboxypeptidase regulatory-like domain-containing protein [bacterium]